VFSESDRIEPAPSEEILVRRGDTLSIRGRESPGVPVLAVGDPGLSTPPSSGFRREGSWRSNGRETG